MAKKNSGLGRGLDAIFLDNSPVNEAEKNANTVSHLKISLIDPRSGQPRKYFDRESLEELASSIREHGLFQPILVREYASGRYQIIAGERRFRASKLAGLTEIPALVLDKSDQTTAEIALIENIQREDLNPVEEAMAYRQLATEYNLTQEELSQKVGKSRSAVANAVRLLDLPEGVLSMVASGELSAGHARTLLGLKNREDMLPMAERVKELDLSVRRLEEEVRLANRPKKAEKEEEPLPIVDYFREMELRVQSTLGRKVHIEGKGRKKSITLFYEDNEDLDELLKMLCGKDFLEEDN